MQVERPSAIAMSAVATASAAHEGEPEELDPARWATLVIAITAAFIVVLDNTVLNVSIPTIVRELHTTLPSVQWVITGYALTFAALLIIGGRLGDAYGHRRIFTVGATLFGAGSLLVSVSTSVGQLILGEAVIEGMGALLIMPTTLAILSGTFRGHERAKAFAAWGATAGVAAAFGPVIGGWLTTNYSWRWSFRINVIIAPLAVIGALVFMKQAARPKRRISIDVPGALLIASGMFLLVFALSQGGVYGWWEPLKALSVAGRPVWPATRAVSAIPILLAVAVGILGTFVWLERRIERAGRDPLFELKHLGLRTYRYGLITVAVVAMGQLGPGPHHLGHLWGRRGRRRAAAGPTSGPPVRRPPARPRGASPQPSEERVTDAELDEEPPSLLLRSLALLGATWNLPPAGGEQDSPERLRGALEASIEHLVRGGGAVILGRAAAVVLGRRPGAFHVRLDGPPEQRARRGAAWEGVDVATARDRLAKADAVRNRTVQRLYGRDLSDPSLYHLVIDATALNLDPLLDVIVSAAEATWRYDEANLEDDVAALRARLTGPATSPDVRDR